VVVDMEEGKPLNYWHLAKCMSEGPRKNDHSYKLAASLRNWMAQMDFV
jgi:hypothetical protein